MKYIFGDSSDIDAHQHKNGGGWVADTAHVDETVFVGPDAQVFGNARVLGNAKICDYAQIGGDAKIYNEARVDGKTQIYGYSLIYRTKQYVLLDLDTFECYGPFSDPSEMSFSPGVNYRIIELEN